MIFLLLLLRSRYKKKKNSLTNWKQDEQKDCELIGFDFMI